MPQSAPTVELAVQGLVKSFGAAVLDRAGLRAPAGRPLTAAGSFVPPERRRIGMVVQDGALFPHLSVAGQVDVVLRPAQLRVSADRSATVDSVQYFGDDAVDTARLPGGTALGVRVLDAPEFGPGDTVDLHDVGGATVGYPRAAR